MITPETDPNHEIVGRVFKYDRKIYFCDSYDTRHGYWLTEIADPDNRRNVSERAIGSNRTIREMVNWRSPVASKGVSDRQYFSILYKAMTDSTKRRKQVASRLKDKSFIRTSFGYPAGVLFSIAKKP